MRLLAVGVSFLSLSMVVGTMHWTRHPELVSQAKLTVTSALWLGYLVLLALRLSNRLYGSKFAKWTIALFVVALLSLSLVSSKPNKQVYQPLSTETLALDLPMSNAKDSSLFLLGTSHQVATLNERETIGLPNESLGSFNQGLEQLPGLTEYLVLNTCNRTEIYGSANDAFEIDSLIQYLARFRELEFDFIRQKTYRRTGSEVVRHLFEVASGIDSQMVGETEILGQLKNHTMKQASEVQPERCLTDYFKKVFRRRSGHDKYRNFPWSGKSGQCSL